MSKYSDPYLVDHFKAIKFKSILSVGCGDGVNLDLAKSIHPKVKTRGCEIRDNYSKGWDICDVTRPLPYPDKSFDVVLVSAVLYDCEYELKEVMEELCRIAKKEVILIEPYITEEQLKSIGIDNAEFTNIPVWPWPNKGITGNLIIIKI